MRRCLACGATHPSTERLTCPACGAEPLRVDGFVSFAPALAHGGGGFDAAYFSELADLEGANFWFRARNEIVLWALEHYGKGFRNLLEIGCGTGFVLRGIADRFSRSKLHGSEIFTAGLGFAARRLPHVDFMQMDARDIPYRDEFDVIGAFDVVEHIEQDVQVLAQVRDALKPGGIFLLTVPQHAWLWSAADDYAHHVRRYARADLHAKIESAGLRVIRSTSFVSFLLPAMLVARLARRKTRLEEFDAGKELKISPWMNRTFFQLMMAELALIRRGVDLPAGGSRLVVARRAA
ncbi:class I SAM-dependent methyltransferase [Variovorax defluvii]|uniref:Class I SAM-dependent methyltransferase n=1 Tax=Variovorax defluvii TaxID=913761 RepID=A0ABP8HD00_9BURK